MSRFEVKADPAEKRGRGTGETPISYLTALYTKPEDSVLNRDKPEIGGSPVPRPLSPADYSFEALEREAMRKRMPRLVEPDFKTRREQVRWRIRHLNLCALDRETRQDAAADPGIEWCPTERQYRIRRRGKAGTQCASAVHSAPSAISAASPPASSPAGLGTALTGGGQKSSDAPSLPTGATQ